MILVELYSKDDCHLCEVAKATLIKARSVYSFELREIKIHDGDEQFESFRDRIPVIQINKEFAYQYRVPEGDLLRRLKRLSEMKR